MFIESEELPEVRSEVTVRIRLPDGAGKLRLHAEVVHVMTPDLAALGGVGLGFGLQFAEMTPERRFMLDQLVAHAQSLEESEDAIADRVVEELGLQDTSASGVGLRLTISEPELRRVKKIRAELAAMRERSDAELLGVPDNAVPGAVREAFERVRARWASLGEEERAPAELRSAAAEIEGHLEDAFERLLRSANAAPPPALVTPPPVQEPRAPALRQEDPTPAPEEPKTRKAPGRATVKNARRFLQRLAPKQPQLKPARFVKPAQPRRNRLLGKAYELLSSRDYSAAEEVLRKALVLDARDEKAQVLLHFVRAREAVAERDFEMAKRQYEAVLRCDPDNGATKKELLMISALT